MRFAVVVLAAGRGSRFGANKLLALLDGRPILQHLLEAVVSAGPEATVVVLGAHAQEVERTIHWRDERRVVNADPDNGLASSLKVGLAAIRALPHAEQLEGILVALGDQPCTRTAVIQALVAAETERPIVVPRYSEDGARNPVLLRRGAWWLAARAAGDQGLGAFIDAHPEMVLELFFDGANPDVDTPADLAALNRPTRAATRAEG